MKPFTVMLAKDAILSKLKFPIIATPKLDGVRAYVRSGQVLSRSNKLIPNAHIQTVLSNKRYEHLDGELIVGDPTDPLVYSNTVSGVMSKDGAPDFSFFTFDHLRSLNNPWLDRIQCITPDAVARLHEFELISNLDSLMQYETKVLNMGYEGLILRDPNGHYKCGRSTVNEGLLLKLKRFTDAEATVVGFEERMANHNVATISETGRTKRSSHKENKFGRGDLGALVCKTPSGVMFNIGTGFTDAQRYEIWKNRAKYLGTWVKYKFFDVGVVEAPRHPVFLGWRDPIDM